MTKSTLGRSAGVHAGLKRRNARKFTLSGKDEDGVSRRGRRRSGTLSLALEPVPVCFKLDSLDATKVPRLIDGDPAVVVVVLVVVLVIENPGEQTDYEDEGDDEDESGKAQDSPAITA